MMFLLPGYFSLVHAYPVFRSLLCLSFFLTHHSLLVFAFAFVFNNTVFTVCFVYMLCTYVKTEHFHLCLADAMPGTQPLTLVLFGNRIPCLTRCMTYLCLRAKYHVRLTNGQRRENGSMSIHKNVLLQPFLLPWIK